MDQVIRVKEALQIIESGDRFNLQCISFDRSRGTGGRMLDLQGCYTKRHSSPADRTKKNPEVKAKNHYQNLTRTIHRDDAHPVSIHIFLLTEINGVPVTLY